MNDAQRRELERAKAWAADMLVKRGSTKRVPLVIGLEELDGITVLDLVEWAESIRAQVPPAFWSESKLEIDYGGGEYGGALTGYYDRPETDADRKTDDHYQALAQIAEKGRRE